MKKIMLVIPLLAISFLVNCGNTTTPSYTVTLNAGEGAFYNDEKTITLLDVKDGTNLDKIPNYETPTKDSSYFTYWTLDGVKISESFVVHNDLNLIAEFFTNKTFTVTLDANGGYFSSKKETRKKISDVIKLTNAICETPNRDEEAGVSYRFTTWYKDKECTDPVIFNTLLTGNLTIYAGWGEEASGDFSIVNEDTSTPIVAVDNVYSITSAGTYSVKGKVVGSQICVNATDNDKITLNFNGATIYSSTKKTAISIAKKKADKVTINLKEGTVNTIFDRRTYGDSSVDEDVDGAIDAKCDLTIKGTGVLCINDEERAPGYSRAIQTSKELKITNASVIAYGVDTTIKAKQSIEIEDASVRLISKIGDGLKTEDIDLSSKGKRTGDIKIVGDTYLEIFSAGDAIDASHDVLIESNDNGEPNITIATSKFSTHTGNVSVDKRDIYMRASYSPDTHYDSDKYWCAVYCGVDKDGEDIWEQVKLKKTIKNSNNVPNPGPAPTPGGGTSGYYYSFNLDKNINKFTIYLFEVSQLEASTIEGDYVAKSKEVTAPSSSSSSNTLGTSSAYVDLSGSSSTISTPSSWGIYTDLVGSSDHSCGVNYSNKGIKADNEITINAGDIDIQSYDDSLHTSYGLFYPGLDEEGKVVVGTGNININGGTIDISSGNSSSNGDDAIHSAGELSISGGNINIAHAYEGIEAGHIIISGGATKLYAYDDGANATNQGKITDPDITITGGTLDITVASGDTDGIDSNGTYNQSGGVVVTRGDPSARANSTGLDTNGIATITGGAFLCLGKSPETTPSCGVNVILNSSLSEAAKTNAHTLKIGSSVSYSFINNSSYGGAYLYYLSTLGTPSIS